MQKIEVFGANKLKGTVKISGSKNASLPILAATLLSRNKIKLKNLPKVRDIETMIKLQNVLRSKGYDVGKVDGILGAKTRQAVRSVQLEFGLSADSWPTKELLRKLLIN